MDLFRTVLLEVLLGRFAGMMLRVKMVAMGYVSVMRGLFMRSAFVVGCGMAVMLGSMLVMLGGLTMMFSGCF